MFHGVVVNGVTHKVNDWVVLGDTNQRFLAQ